MNCLWWSIMILLTSLIDLFKGPSHYLLCWLCLLYSARVSDWNSMKCYFHHFPMCDTNFWTVAVHHQQQPSPRLKCYSQHLTNVFWGEPQLTWPKWAVSHRWHFYYLRWYLHQRVRRRRHFSCREISRPAWSLFLYPKISLTHKQNNLPTIL